MPKRIGTHWMQCPKEIIRNPFENYDLNSGNSIHCKLILIGFLLVISQ